MRNLTKMFFLFLVVFALVFGCKSEQEAKTTETETEVVEPARPKNDSIPVVYLSSSSSIDPLTAKQLDFLAEYIKEQGAKKVTVVGHTAKLNSELEEYNDALNRAVRVGEYLNSKDFLMDVEIVPVSKGATEPVQDDIGGRYLNRRVEIILE